MMLKTKIYLDTSVVSHLEATDKPKWRAETHKLWEQLKQGEYIIVVSPVLDEELRKCDEPLYNKLLDYLSQIPTKAMDETEDMSNLAEEYLKTGVLKEKSRNDCRHIAIASMSDCKYILSWNMNHFVKRKTMEMVEEINGKIGIFQPKIMNPTMFIEGDEEDE